MALTVQNLYHTYQPGTPNESHALKNISLSIVDGEFVGFIGHTGSGKSTLVQHFNGLLKPTQGEVLVDGVNINAKGTRLKEIRLQVGLVFQYPEYQLFEETVEKDIAFGPGNLGLDEAEISKRVKNSMEAVGLDYETYKDKSPFDLSGGQKRRVAIAGVIAMNPEVLILDEPTAGLDPGGRDEIFNLIKKLHRDNNITIILSSHSMDDMAKLAQTIIVMNHGKIEFMGTPREVFTSHADKLREIGLDVPQVLELATKLRQKGFDIRPDILTVEEVKDEILKVMRGRKKC